MPIESSLVAGLRDRYGIRFTEPLPGHLYGVKKLIDPMAEVLNKPEISIDQMGQPAHGFLKNPLTDEQKKAVNDTLGPIYAQESVQFQERLANLPIEESGEKMVSLVERLSRAGSPRVSFSDKPFHPASLNGWAGKPRVFWVRETVADKLVSAATALNEVGIMPHFEDGFRPIGVQEGLLKRRVQEIIIPAHPDWDPVDDFEKIMTEAQSKTAIKPVFAGHKGGAAVDLTLRTLDGIPLPLGNEYPQGDALVNLDCPYVTREQWKTRQVFKNIMLLVGMNPYPGEDWHGSFGDNLAGANPDGSPKDGYVAQYGPIKGFDPQTGEIEPYHPTDYDRPFFSREELQALAVRAKQP